MSSKKKLLHLKKLYDQGTNIIEHLKSGHSEKKSDAEDILLSYDLQAG